MIYLYQLICDGRVMYAGLTKNPTVRKSDHKRTKPPHTFCVVGEFNCVNDASYAERNMIAELLLVQRGWNKSPGGDYEGNSGYQRHGIGGVKKGTLPWNYKRRGVFSEETRRAWSKKRKGRVHSSKLTSDQWEEIKMLYRQRPQVEGSNTKSKNGKLLPYKRAFANAIAPRYDVTSANIYRIIKNES